MPGNSYRDKLKSTIVQVSRELLVAEGLEGLQARKVATAAGCSVGTIYNLFGNLDTVIVTANAETLAELHDKLVEVRSDTFGSLAERLERLALAYLGFAIERQNEWRAIFEHRPASKFVVPDWYRAAQSELFAIVESVLSPVIAEPERRQEAARALFGAVHGIVALALDQKLGDFDGDATERQVRLIVNAAAGGLGGSASAAAWNAGPLSGQ